MLGCYTICKGLTHGHGLRQKGGHCFGQMSISNGAVQQYSSTHYRRGIGLSRPEMCKVGTLCNHYLGHTKLRESKVSLGYVAGQPYVGCMCNSPMSSKRGALLL